MPDIDKKEVLIPYCKFQSSPTNSKWGYYNIQGNKVCGFSFRYCSLFNGDYAVFGDYKIKNYPYLCYGLIDRNFNVIHSPIFSCLNSVHTRPNSFEGFLDTTFNDNNAVYLNITEKIFLTGSEIYLLKCGLTLVERHLESINCYNSKGSLLFSRPVFISDENSDWYGFDKVVDCGSQGFFLLYSNIETEEINMSMWKGEEFYDTFYTTHIKKIFFDINGNIVSPDSFNHEAEYGINVKLENSQLESIFLKENKLITLSYNEVAEDLISNGFLYEDNNTNLTGFRLYQADSGLKFWSEETSLPKTIAFL